MAKDLRLDVVTSSDDKGLVESALALNELAKEADKVGNQFKETAVDGGILAAELDRVKRKQLELAAAFDATGDKALLKQISRNQTYERQLKRVGTALDEVGGSVEKEASKLGKNIAKDTESGFLDTLTRGGGFGSAIGDALMSPPGLAVAGAAASVVGVMVGGAVLTGIGLAGIGGGIAIALHDPKVKAAEASLKSEIGGALKDAAQPMVAPLIDAFGQLGSLIKTDIAPGLKNMFTQLAPEIGGLTHGFGQFLSSVATGFEHAAVAAKPLLNVLGSSLLPGLGKDIQAVFDTIARHSKEAEQGLKLIFIAIEAGLGIVNVAINVFSTLFDYMTFTFEGGVLLADKFVGAMLAVEKALHLPHQDLDAAKHSLDGFLGDVDGFRTGADGMTSGFNAAAGAAAIYAGATDKAAQKTAELNKRLEAMDKLLQNDQAYNDAQDQIAGIAKEIDKHSHSLDRNSTAGRHNRETIDEKIAALKRDRDTLIKNGMSADDANRKFQGWVKALEKSAEKAGVSRSAINKLNRELGLIPKSKTVTIRIRHTGDKGVNITDTGIKFYASGGRYQAGVPRVVGENGPEFDIPDHSGVIVPGGSGAVSSVMPGAAAAGGGVQRVEVVLKGDTPAMRALISMLAAEVRGSFGGNVQVAFGGHN